MTDFDPRRLFTFAAITDKNREFFAGRRDLLASALDTIAAGELSLFIYGDGGVGKTSFANQIRAILGGDLKVIKQWGLDKLLRYQVQKSNCAAIAVSLDIVDLESLLVALLWDSGDFSLRKLCPKAFEDASVRDEIHRAYELNLAFLRAEVAVEPGGDSPRSSRRSYAEWCRP